MSEPCERNFQLTTAEHIEGAASCPRQASYSFNEGQTLTETMLERAQLDLGRTRISAPVSGVVVEEMVEAESFVSKGSPLVTIEDTSAAGSESKFADG